MDKLALGSKGEDLACALLEQKGYRILERNYRDRKAEIDLIACYGEFLIGVEVKTRQGNSRLSPRLNLNRKKGKMLRWAMTRYAVKTGFRGELRIDLIEVKYDACKFSLNHVKGFVDSLSD